RSRGHHGDLSRRRGGPSVRAVAVASAERVAPRLAASGGRSRHRARAGRHRQVRYRGGRGHAAGRSQSERRARDPLGRGRARCHRTAAQRPRHGEGGLSMWLDPFRDWLLSFGAAGAALWIVLKILAIAMPVIIAVAFYVLWERKLIGWMHARRGPMYVGMCILQTFADVF